MGRGGYYGGSTVVGPGSGWFTFEEEENSSIESEKGQEHKIVVHEIKKAFLNDIKEKIKIKSTIEISRIVPKAGERKDSLFIVWELSEYANKIEDIENTSDAGIRMLGLDLEKHYRQIKLVDNSSDINGGYIALVPDYLVHDIEVNEMVVAEIVACVSGDFSQWLVIRINAI